MIDVTVLRDDLM